MLVQLPQDEPTPGIVQHVELRVTQPPVYTPTPESYAPPPGMPSCACIHSSADCAVCGAESGDALPDYASLNVVLPSYEEVTGLKPFEVRAVCMHTNCA